MCDDEELSEQRWQCDDDVRAHMGGNRSSKLDACKAADAAAAADASMF